MMNPNTTRWQSIAAVLLCVNLAGVAGTSWWHLATAGETETSERQVASHDSAPDDTTTQEPASKIKTATLNEQAEVSTKLESDPNALHAEVFSPADPTSTSQPATAKNSGAGSLIPEDFPDSIPPEADADSLKDDAVFQEIQKLFASDNKQLLSPESLPPSVASSDQMQVTGRSLSATEVERQRQRVEYAAQLAEVARAMLADVHQELSEGNAETASEIHGMATSLRIMAAKLLKSE